jgi:hypothetical protein
MNVRRRLLQEMQARPADARLEALLVEGLTSGEEIPLTQKFWSDLRRDADKILASQTQSGQTRARE